jgi:hypothetical protein
MKKISLLLLSLFIFSCVQEEIVQDVALQEENSVNSTAINAVSSRGNDSTYNFHWQERLDAKLKIYAYAIGRIFKNDFEQANSNVQSYIEITNNDVIPLSYFLDTPWFSTKIREQLEDMQNMDFAYSNSALPGAPGPPFYPPVGPTQPWLEVFRYTTTQEIGYLNHRNFSESTGVELFIARDLIANSAVNITSHPLDNSNASFGYVFTNPTNSNATFDATFLNNHPNNVLIVRPYRDATHTYNYIDVADFTTYYSN